MKILTVAAWFLALGSPPPQTLGDALRAVGAFEVVAPDGDDRPGETVDRSLRPPPPPPRTGAKFLMVLGGAFVVTGFIGSMASPGCETRDADGNCITVTGADSRFPVLLGLGLAALIAGSWAYHQDVVELRE